MKILCDSREKWTQPNSKDTHISAYFDRHGIEWEVCALGVGDYQIEGKPTVSVDRKKNLSELSKNLMNRDDKGRFWREVRRAKEQGIKLYILCEHGGQIKSIRDVAKWKDKYSGVSGRTLMEKIFALHIGWGVEVLFCDKRSTARIIVEILQENVDK